MVRRWVTWGVVAALLVFASGAMQLAHHATAHSASISAEIGCSHEHEHSGERSIPAPHSDHEDCPVCHLLANWHATAPVAAALPLSLIVSIDLPAMPDERPTLALLHGASGPRAPPFCA